MFRRRSSRFFVLFVAMLFALPGSARSFNAVISQTRIFPADGQLGRGFGFDVAGDGDTIIVSTDPTVSLFKTAAVYVFARSKGGYWLQQAKLTPSVEQRGGNFGQSIDISGDTIVVAHPDFRDVYIFVRQGNLWHQQARLTPPPEIGADFGQAVAIDDDTIVVGDEGAVHVYARRPGTATWTYQAKLAVPIDYGQYFRFGSAVDISRNTIVVEMSKSGGGSASVFVRNPDTQAWSQQTDLVPMQEYVGIGADLVPIQKRRRITGGACSVSIDVDKIVIGLCGEQTGFHLAATGAIYVFERNLNRNVWMQTARLVPQGARRGFLAPYGFGTTTSIEGDTIAVLAKGYGELFPGVEAPVYVFKHYEDGQWLQQAKILPINKSPNRGGFFSVAAWEDTIAAGEIFARDDRGNLIGGAVHIIETDAVVDSPEDP